MENRNKANKKETKPKPMETKKEEPKKENQPNSISNANDTHNVQQSASPFPEIKNNLTDNKTIEKTKANDFNLNKNIKEEINTLNNIMKENLKSLNSLNGKINNKQLDSNSNNSSKNQNIDYHEALEKLNKYDYIINVQNIIKKVLIIILSIIHCLSLYPLQDRFMVKYTFIFLEIGSLLFNKYYYDQKQIYTNNVLKNKIDDIKAQQIGNMEKIADFMMNNFGIVNKIFSFINLIKDILADIAILLILNILFFLNK